METAYPFTLENADNCKILQHQESDLTRGYPATPHGQTAMLRNVLSIVRAVPYERGLGVMYWDATWTAVPGNGWDPDDPDSGNECENRALFDFEYCALPALDEFKP